MKPYYQKANVTIWCGDSRVILPEIIASRLERPVPEDFVLITDPPYGVLEPGDFNPRVCDDRGGPHGLARKPYATYQDTYENFVSTVIPVLNLGIKNCIRAAVFTGPHITEQEKPAALGGIYCPSGSGRHQWGYKTLLPVLFYGTAPNLDKGARSNVMQSAAVAHKNGHPCPKPLDWMLWLIRIASKEGEVIIDPFNGSGTTLVAAKLLGRAAVGIDLEERYCEIAVKRLDKTPKPLFLPEKPKIPRKRLL